MSDIKTYQGYVNQTLMDAGKHNDSNYIKIMHSMFKQGHLNFEQCTMFFRTLIRKADQDAYREYLDVNKAVADQVQDMMDYGWITEDGEYTEHCLNKLKEMGFGKTMGETTPIDLPNGMELMEEE
jgi:polyhydroxyalkanoate synthesis regulator phasin